MFFLTFSSIFYYGTQYYNEIIIVLSPIKCVILTLKIFHYSTQYYNEIIIVLSPIKYVILTLKMKLTKTIML